MEPVHTNLACWPEKPVVDLVADLNVINWDSLRSKCSDEILSISSSKQ